MTPNARPHAQPDPRLAADPLPGPFAAQSGPEMDTPAVVEALAAGQVKALLESAPAFYQLPEAQREKMRADLNRITSYTAALIHDDWSQSARLHQTPMVRARHVIEGEIAPNPARGRPPSRSLAARSLADGFQRTEDGGFTPVAASNIARITQDTLNAIAFPTFVADLIKGTFQAIVDASIQQMEAYATLLSNVAKTVINSRMTILPITMRAIGWWVPTPGMWHWKPAGVRPN